MEGTAPTPAKQWPGSERAGALLRRRGWQVAVAESCTGGLLGAALTAVPGASAYVRGGVVAYADSVKTAVLGVPTWLLVARGAVSEEVALAMARGVASLLGADVGVGVTGVAGPGADDGGKPAGLVFVAVTAPPGERVVRLEGDRGRDGNRGRAVDVALDLIGDLG